MLIKTLTAIGILCLCLFAVSAPTFTVNPSLTKDAGGKWWAEFTVSETTDVEISIVRLSDSSVVRHLAAGLLGGNAPAPLTAGSLHQKIEWDGLDDFKQPVTGTVSVRIRAGMRPEMDRIVRSSPFRFASIGAIRHKAGKVFVLGLLGNGGNALGSENTVREFRLANDSLTYVRTLFPYPGGQKMSNYNPFGLIDRNSGLYSPKFVRAYSPYCNEFLNVELGSGALMPVGVNDELVVSNAALKCMNMGGTGVQGTTFRYVTSPALTPYFYGAPYTTPAQDSGYVLLSGIYGCFGMPNGFAGNLDSGFWADGGVWKVNRATGAATRWLSLDSVPLTPTARPFGYWAAVRGVCTDDSGRVYVCDRMHGSVNVYDASAALLGSFKVVNPEMVAVDPASGAVYVLTSAYTTGYALKKFSTWRAGGVQVWSQTLGTGGVSYYGIKGAPFASYVQDGKVSFLYGTDYLNLYRDEGATCRLVSTAGKPVAPGIDNTAFYRPVSVDRVKEVVYYGDHLNGLYKIENWLTGTPLACSTSTGAALTAIDAYVSPDNSRLVTVTAAKGANVFRGPLESWTLDHRHAKREVLAADIYGRFGQGNNIPGLAITPDNRAIVQPYGTNAVSFYSAAGIDTLIQVAGGGYSNSCPRFDLQGNLYMSLFLTPAAHVPPAAGYLTDPLYKRDQQFVVSFPAATLAKARPDSVGAGLAGIPATSKIYSKRAVISSVGMDMSTCVCGKARFDVDYYGRLFLSNLVTSQVSVVDNNDNLIMEFGQYGNADSWGPGSPVPLASIPIGAAYAVAASDNFIYVPDALNCRLLRVRMSYALDNMPLPAAEAQSAEAGRTSLRLSACPNPFTPSVRIAVESPGRSGGSELLIFAPDGRLVKSYGRLNAGRTSVSWNASGLPSGMYVAELRAGNRKARLKLMLLK